MSHTLHVRPATLCDAAILFAWRNDPLTRAMSKTSEPIMWDTHLAWLQARLARPDPKLFVVAHGGHLVGTFRLDGEEISYTVAPQWRGNGYATAMLRAARQRFGALRAEIFKRNVASLRAAEKAGVDIIMID